MKKTGLMLGLLFLCILVAAKPIEILSESENELFLKFTLPAYLFHEIERDGVIYQQIVCDGSAAFGDPGYPLLPFFAEIIGLPLDGNFDLTIIDKKQIILTQKNIYPADVPVNTSDEVQFVFKPNSQFQLRNSFFPELLLEKGEAAHLGDRYFNSFKIFPFRYNPGRDELLVTTELTFRVNIHGDVSASRSWGQSKNIIDGGADDFYLNNKFSKKWRKSRPEPIAVDYPRSEGVNAFQIIVNQPGIYKINYEFLADSLSSIMESNPEWDFNFQIDQLDPRYLELTDENGAIPIHFVGDLDGSFDDGDYFEFYGDIHHGETTYYDDYTSENVYTISIADHFGSRLAVENGGIVDADPANYVIPVAFKQQIHFEKQNTKENLGWQFSYHGHGYFREDFWFWNSIMAPDMREFPFDLQYPLQSAFRRYDAKVCLFGVTYDQDNQNIINHHAVVRINSSIIGNEMWNGQREQIFENENPIANSGLQHGSNNLFISLPGIDDVDNEKVLLDYLDLTYWREYKTDTNSIRFHKPENKPAGLFQFELENFSSDDVTVYKIGSSIMENIILVPFLDSGSAPFKVVFQDEVAYSSIEYIAVTENQKKLPLLIRADSPSTLKDPNNSAEYIIITGEQFKESEGTLLFEEIWEGEGFNVEIVSVQDVFDEFNNGIRSAQAVKDFVKYAYDYWNSPILSHVMLLGDGMLDERDNSYHRKFSIVPTSIIWTYGIGAAADDNWFGCVVGDDIVPDIGISRISVWKEEQIVDVANKTLHYLEETNYQDLWHSKAIYAAGGNEGEGSIFAVQSEFLIDNYFPEEFHAERVYCNVQGLPENYLGNTTDLVGTINDGAIYMQFIGHGGGHVWADYNLLNLADIATFNNENYPFVASLACYGSAFNNPQSSCIGEELVLVPGKGGIGHFGFTGYGYVNADKVMATFINEAIFHIDEINSLGEIISYAKAKHYGHYSTSAMGVALICAGALLGDPMIKLFPTKEERVIELNEYNLEPGDTLQISSNVGSDVIKGKFVIYDENDVQLPFDEYFPMETYAIDGVISASDYIVPFTGSDIYFRTIKLFAYGTDYEVIGITQFTVGQSAVINFTLIPEIPTESDTVMVEADFFDKDGISQVECIVDSLIIIPMENIAGSRYKLSSAISAHSAIDTVFIQFRIIDDGDPAEVTISRTFHYNITGPDMAIVSLELGEYDNNLAFTTIVQNSGFIQSPECFLRVYSYTDSELLSEVIVPGIMPGGFETIHAPLPLLNGTYQFHIVVNQDQESFSELYYSNNYKVTGAHTINMFEVGIEESESSSLDEILDVQFPANIFNQETVCLMEKLDDKIPVNQPDIGTILMTDGQPCQAYNIRIMNEDLLADSLNMLPGNNRIRLKFHYCVDDTVTQENEADNNFAVYRWEEDFSKWIFNGGEIYTQEDYVSYYASRLGIYSLRQNNDTTPPTISVNVEGQEFNLLNETPFISKNGIISFILADENGINGIDRSINLEIDGEAIEQENFFVSVSPGHLEQLPVKLHLSQLDLDSGIHHVFLDCTDLNGNYSNIEFDFLVSDKFGVNNVANYPNPVVSKTVHAANKGRTRFTYVLQDDADIVTLKVYTVNGRLVKTFRNLPASVGYHEFPTGFQGWDCRDEDGFFLANGVYFYKIIAKKGNKKAEKTQKMAILK